MSLVRAPLVGVTLFAAACISPSLPSPPDLAQAPPKVVTAPIAPPPPVNAEVEIGGKVQRPAGAKGEVKLWVTDGPCWQPTTHALGDTKGTPDNFFVEVFVKQGTPLWLCAALVDGNKPLSLYGQPDTLPLLGKGVGEVSFTNEQVTLRKGKPVRVPPPLP